MAGQDSVFERKKKKEEKKRKAMDDDRRNVDDACCGGRPSYKTESLGLLSTSNGSCNTGRKRDGRGTQRTRCHKRITAGTNRLSVSLEIGETLSRARSRDLLLRPPRSPSHCPWNSPDKWAKFATMTVEAPNEIKEARSQRVNIWTAR